MKRKQFLVYHPSQLNSLSTLPWSHRAGLGKIVLAESFGKENKEQFESELNISYYACGCDQGAKALLLGLMISSIAGITGYFYGDWSPAQTIGTIASGSILMAMAGKFSGLLTADRKLKQTVRKIQSVWTPKWREATSIDCG